VEASAPKIKFCGITDLDDADAAIAAGAWALGLILWPGSPRRCRREVAVEISAAHRRHAQIVGVFVNPSLDQVTRAADEIGLTMLQLHGDEGPVFCAEVARRTGCRVIKAARVHSGADIQAIGAFHTDFHLLDSYRADKRGGTGETFEWGLISGHAGRVPLILSGGLNAENVGDAISAVHPYAVDVASGVELSPGRKDVDKLAAFAAAVAATAPAVPEPDVPEPDVPAPDEPTSDVPAPDEPTPDVPAPDAPTSDVPAPVLPAQ
jgi:phosphoribosylanthranilate isomerase